MLCRGVLLIDLPRIALWRFGHSRIFAGVVTYVTYTCSHSPSNPSRRALCIVGVPRGRCQMTLVSLISASSNFMVDCVGISGQPPLLGDGARRRAREWWKKYAAHLWCPGLSTPETELDRDCRFARISVDRWPVLHGFRGEAGEGA